MSCLEIPVSDAKIMDGDGLTSYDTKLVLVGTKSAGNVHRSPSKNICFCLTSINNQIIHFHLTPALAAIGIKGIVCVF